MRRIPIGRGLHLATLTAICALAGAAAAQDMPPTLAPPPAIPAAPAPLAEQQSAAVAPQATAPVPGPATPAVHPLGKAQLEQIVAPIALYPDPLLSQVLMASTYPLEIVEADRWVRIPANAGLKDGALTDALKQQSWDPSVKALVPFPKLLSLLADKLEWAEALGNVFLAQQADVMDAVQALRHNAMQAGNLKVTPQCHCVIQTSGDVISILPADTSQVCIPVYNPRVAYGPWPWPDYPPDYFPVPVGFAFEPGYAIGYWPLIEVAAFGPLWGWAWFDWGHHDVTVDRGRYTTVSGGLASFSGNTWVHDPGHRGGVAYHDPAVTNRFGAARTAAVTAAAGRGASARGGAASTGAAATRVGAAGRGSGSSAGRFGGTAAAGHGGGHVGHASFAGARAGGGGHGGGAHFGGAAHFGGGHGGGGGHVAHAQFSPGGGGHFGGGGPHFGGGGGGHGGGGGGGGHGGGGGGGHGGGGHH
jgi:hypothetical protein